SVAALPDALHDLLRSPGRSVRSLAWRALHRGARLERPIFVIGSPRSGTTLAVDLFATHPDVANWSEAGRVWDPTHYDDPEAEHVWRAEDATPARVARLHRWFEWYRRSQRRTRFVNKHPRNSLRIPFLLLAFPDARFIHVIRDGRGVVSSVLEEIRRSERRQRLPMGGFAKPAGWRQMLRDDLALQSALQWQAIVRTARAEGAPLGAAYTEVRYETLCAVPRETYRALFHFAGLRSGDAALAGIPARLEESEGWRHRLTTADRARIERSAAGLLNELGYLP
ncbi:MAG TPA: sulfotransferase, partial [Myxococcota bacterium]|nr:sulfotransferase [Myxococcota bacterium]